MAHLWPEPQTLHRTGAEPLDQRISTGDQGQRDGNIRRRFQIERHIGLATPGHFELRRARHAKLARRHPVDHDDLRTQIGKHHAADWPRPDAEQFNHPQAHQRTAFPRCRVAAHAVASVKPLIRA